MNILIVGGGLQALSVARSLKKERYSVIAVSYTHLTLPTIA